ncbi:hypothetical protein LTR85_010338 [Meristemomyces frigidus]|nr:hypothetical protein LTR85_010338 [Meristemomyces frigidus]
MLGGWNRGGTVSNEDVIPEPCVPDANAPRQNLPWDCGIHTILNGWVAALGLQYPARGPTRPNRIASNSYADFNTRAIEIIQLAVLGHMDSATIEAFLKCFGFIAPDSVVPPDRVFNTTMPFARVDDYTMHVARVRLVEDLTRIRQNGTPELPPLDTLLETIGRSTILEVPTLRNTTATALAGLYEVAMDEVAWRLAEARDLPVTPPFPGNARRSGPDGGAREGTPEETQEQTDFRIALAASLEDQTRPPAGASRGPDDERSSPPSSEAARAADGTVRANELAARQLQDQINNNGGRDPPVSDGTVPGPLNRLPRLPPGSSNANQAPTATTASMTGTSTRTAGPSAASQSPDMAALLAIPDAELRQAMQRIQAREARELEDSLRREQGAAPPAPQDTNQAPTAPTPWMPLTPKQFDELAEIEEENIARRSNETLVTDQATADNQPESPGTIERQDERTASILARRGAVDRLNERLALHQTVIQQAETAHADIATTSSDAPPRVEGPSELRWLEHETARVVADRINAEEALRRLQGGDGNEAPQPGAAAARVLADNARIAALPGPERRAEIAATVERTAGIRAQIREAQQERSRGHMMDMITSAAAVRDNVGLAADGDLLTFNNFLRQFNFQVQLELARRGVETRPQPRDPDAPPEPGIRLEGSLSELPARTVAMWRDLEGFERSDQNFAHADEIRDQLASRRAPIPPPAGDDEDGSATESDPGAQLDEAEGLPLAVGGRQPPPPGSEILMSRQNQLRREIARLREAHARTRAVTAALKGLQAYFAEHPGRWAAPPEGIQMGELLARPDEAGDEDLRRALDYLTFRGAQEWEGTQRVQEEVARRSAAAAAAAKMEEDGGEEEGSRGPSAPPPRVRNRIPTIAQLTEDVPRHSALRPTRNASAEDGSAGPPNTAMRDFVAMVQGWRQEGLIPDAAGRAAEEVEAPADGSGGPEAAASDESGTGTGEEARTPPSTEPEGSNASQPEARGRPRLPDLLDYGDAVLADMTPEERGTSSPASSSPSPPPHDGTPSGTDTFLENSRRDEIADFGGEDDGFVFRTGGGEDAEMISLFGEEPPELPSTPPPREDAGHAGNGAGDWRLLGRGAAVEMEGADDGEDEESEEMEGIDDGGDEGSEEMEIDGSGFDEEEWDPDAVNEEAGDNEDEGSEEGEGEEV